MAIVFVCAAGGALIWYVMRGSVVRYTHGTQTATPASHVSKTQPTLDKALYNKKMIAIANNPVPKPKAVSASSTATSSVMIASSSVPTVEQVLAHASASTSISIPGKLWPVSTIYPNYGALLPFNRIVAYYGNFYSKAMGVLGQYPTDQMLTMLKSEVAKWKAADPGTPVIPAIDYIAITAQGSAGKDGMYRLRMPDDQIDIALDLAKQIDGIVFLDIQVGLSDLKTELPLLESYLKLPNVHLAIDPEFSMKTGAKPGTVIGTFDASDVNYAANFLAKLVQDNNLPPKVLVVHRFTEKMVTNTQNIKPLKEVQIVMDMDGWGPVSRKLKTYNDVITTEPVQFTGFKLFYKNDLLSPSTGMLTPEQLLKLNPIPNYIQYQ